MIKRIIGDVSPEEYDWKGQIRGLTNDPPFQLLDRKKAMLLQLIK